MAGFLGAEFEVSADGVEYVRISENILSGNGFSYDGINPVIGKTPGAPALIAAHRIVAGSLRGFHIVQLTILFIGYLAVMVITRRTLGMGAAIAVLLVLVLLQPIRGLASNALSEPLFIAGFAWGLSFAQRALRDGNLREAWLAGLSFAIATYARPVSFFLPVALLVLVVIAHRNRFRAAAFVLVAHMVIVLPWVARGYSEFGKVFPMASNWGPMLTMTDDDLWHKFSKTGTKDVYVTPHFAQASERGFLFNYAPQEILREATVDGWKNDPIGTVWRCVKQSAFVWTYCPGTKEWATTRPLVFWIGRVAMVVFLLASIAGLRVLWRSNRPTALLIGGQVLYTAAIMFPVASESRYLVPSYVCLMPATIAGVMAFFNNRRMREH
jgi:hypothetical protein